LDRLDPPFDAAELALMGTEVPVPAGPTLSSTLMDAGV
jgi:hypothetical protein